MSATGTLTADAPAGRAVRQGGFTLIEILVVLVVFAVATSVAVLGLGAAARLGGDPLAALRADIAALRAQALRSGRAAALGLTADRYVVFDRIEGRWTERPGAGGPLPAMNSVEISGSLVRFDDPSAPLSPPSPLIVVSPDGDLTAFALLPADPKWSGLRVDTDGALREARR